MNKQNNYFEIIVGTFVLICAAVFFTNSFRSAKVKNSGGYTLVAKFENIDGIANGSDVKIAGVKIGTVENQAIDQESYRAILSLNLDSKIKIPADSSAKIASEGLLGSKYLAITPGSDEEILKNGEEISYTQSSVNLEDLLGKFIFGSNSNKSDKNEKK